VNTVLHVEDSVESFELVKRVLGSSVKLEWAKTLGEAYRKLEKQQFNLILLDVMLPDGDGYRLCSILQTVDERKYIPVIFLTAKNSTSDKIMGFSVGAVDFISKPVDPIELKLRVNAMFRKVAEQKPLSKVHSVGDISTTTFPLQ
jgi:DNA-binding response OmpR family regulator